MIQDVYVSGYIGFLDNKYLAFSWLQSSTQLVYFYYKIEEDTQSVVKHFGFDGSESSSWWTESNDPTH